MIKPSRETQAAGPRLQRYLEKHGASAELKTERGTLRVSDSLISRAEETGADVVVMGAFGRARLQEVVTGGATTALTLENTTVPLLLAG